MYKSVLFSSVFLSGLVHAANTSAPLEHIEVKGVKNRLLSQGILKDSISKTELIDASQIKNMQASNLTEAIEQAIGIRVSNECSMCGAKRVMINGMKGEHTNVLIDGIPMHTMISGFYGMDSVATAGIGEIEIARGAGASLTSPEAIGGTINLVSKKPTSNRAEIDMAFGEQGYRQASFVAMGLSKDELTTASVIAQLDKREQFDGDGNGVSESPLLDNRNFVAIMTHELSSETEVKVRFGQSHSEVFGGPVIGESTQGISDTLASVSLGEAPALFENDRVDGSYIGNAWETAEWVDTEREEWLVSVIHGLSHDLTLNVRASHVTHDQDSFYESVDYIAKDTMRYVDIKFYYDLNDQHTLTFGVDNRDEEMRSHSAALEDNPLYMSDSFDYRVYGAYIQDTYSPNMDLEVAFALRVDKIEANFIDNPLSDNEIEETLISPRFDARWSHTDDWTSRISIGQGYRAPLSFFESDHGILDAGLGYLVEVEKVERSLGYNYALSVVKPQFNATASVAYTQVDDLAQLDSTSEGTPVLTQLSEEANVWAYDISANYKVNELWTLGISVEAYRYNDAFKSTFGIAPTEKRATLDITYQQDALSFNSKLSLVPSRDLAEYGYHGFNDQAASEPKQTDVSGYATLDFKLTYSLSEQLSVYMGANNLFDYNQADNEESPLLFDVDGGYDVTYIYAPLRGRMAYIGFDYDF